ncbi:hypothetical protein [Rhodoplanes sp. SY1]|uniref:hypothetical protein n=1 Tax=Rhodoplanes sp. SY1 TaxID=3166646 RepID=UPI0038B53C24
MAAVLMILVGFVLILPLPLVSAVALLVDYGLKTSKGGPDLGFAMLWLGCLAVATFGAAMIRVGWRMRGGATAA